MLHGVVVPVGATAAGPDLPGHQVGLLGLSCGCHELAEGQSLLSSVSELGWWTGRTHLSLSRTWQVASVPASGSGGRGLGSERP